MGKSNQAPKANTQDTQPITDPTAVAALVTAETIAEVIERYGMGQEDFDALPEASRDALVAAHVAEKELKLEKAALEAREARVTKAEEAMTTVNAGRFYEPALDESKSDDEKLAKYAGIIKTLLEGGLHPMFTLVANQNVEGNHTVTAVVPLPRTVRYQNRDEPITLVAFNERAFANNPADLPEDDASLQRGTALRQTA